VIAFSIEMKNIYLVIDNPLSERHAVLMCKMIDAACTELCFVCLDKDGNYQWLEPKYLISCFKNNLTFVTENTEGYDMMFISNPGFMESGVGISPAITGYENLLKYIKDFVENDTTKKVLINEFHHTR